MNLKQLSEKVELVSIGYASKHGIRRSNDWFVFKVQEEVGELVQKYLVLTDRARKKGKTDDQIRLDFEEEVADTIGHLLLLSKHFDIDLEKVMQEKWFVYLD